MKPRGLWDARAAVGRIKGCLLKYKTFHFQLIVETFYSSCRIQGTRDLPDIVIEFGTITASSRLQKWVSLGTSGQWC